MFRDYLLDWLDEPSHLLAGNQSLALPAFSPDGISDVHAENPLSPKESIKVCFVIGLSLAAYLAFRRASQRRGNKKEDDTKENKPEEEDFGCLYVAVFLDAFGAYMLIPYLGLISAALGVNAFRATLISAVYATFQTVGSVVIGILADKYNRKSILVLTLGAGSVSLFCCGLSLSLPTGGSINFAYWGIFFSRAFAGFFASTVSLIQTVIQTRCKPELRVKHIGYVMSIFGAGTIISPSIAGGVFQFGYVFLCFLGGTVTAVNVMYVTLTLEPEPRSQYEDEEEPAAVRDAFRVVKSNLVIQALLIGAFLDAGSQAMILTILSMYNALVYGWKGGMVGTLIGVSGAVAASLTSQSKRVVNVIGEVSGIIIGNTFRFSALLAYTIYNPGLPWLLIPFIMTTGIMIDVQIQSMMYDNAPKQSIGTLIGVMQALRSGGEALLPPISGYLLDIDVLLPWFCSAGISVIFIVLFSLVCHVLQKKSKGI